jgi:hypothetical protein
LERRRTTRISWTCVLLCCPPNQQARGMQPFAHGQVDQKTGTDQVEGSTLFP